MNEPNTPAEASAKPWYRADLFLFITGSLVIAIILVVISMALYESSGAAQLDLSRPGYKAVQGEIRSDTFESFPANGPVTRETLEQFKELYEKQVTPVTGKDAFNPGALDDEVLGIGDQATGR